MSRLLIAIAAIVVLAISLLTIVSPRPQGSSHDLEKLSQIRPTQGWYQERVFNNPKPVLVDFTATWCGPCKMLNQTLAELEQKYGGQFEVVKIDVDEHPDLASMFQVDGIPFVMVYHQGKVVAAEQGMVWYEGIEGLLKPYLGKTPPTAASPDASQTTAKVDSTQESAPLATPVPQVETPQEPAATK